ncbi:hypothetical protein F01_140172 [Burkholderia cenocepacia]|nr:hypothetical protein F01_140172 [Burkholderia cenocepacia]
MAWGASSSPGELACATLGKASGGWGGDMRLRGRHAWLRDRGWRAARVAKWPETLRYNAHRQKSPDHRGTMAGAETHPLFGTRVGCARSIFRAMTIRTGVKRPFLVSI